MSERVPAIRLELSDGNELAMTPENSALYTFIGETAIGDTTIDNTNLNHIFVVVGREESAVKGMYFFKELDREYPILARHMTDHRYPMHLNQAVVPEHDLKAWLGRVDTETERFTATIPDEL